MGHLCYLWNLVWCAYLHSVDAMYLHEIGPVYKWYIAKKSAGGASVLEIQWNMLFRFRSLNVAPENRVPTMLYEKEKPYFSRWDRWRFFFLLGKEWNELFRPQLMQCNSRISISSRYGKSNFFHTNFEHFFFLNTFLYESHINKQSCNNNSSCPLFPVWMQWLISLCIIHSYEEISSIEATQYVLM